MSDHFFKNMVLACLFFILAQLMRTGGEESWGVITISWCGIVYALCALIGRFFGERGER